MIVDTTVYGWYIPDVGPICATCAGLDYWSTGIAKLLGEDGPQPLFSIDNTENNGLTCDDAWSLGCTGWVFEPFCGECYDDNLDLNKLNYDDAEDRYLCDACVEETGGKNDGES